MSILKFASDRVRVSSILNVKSTMLLSQSPVIVLSGILVHLLSDVVQCLVTAVCPIMLYMCDYCPFHSSFHGMVHSMNLNVIHQSSLYFFPVNL